MSKVNIMGVNVDNITMDEAVDKVMDFLKSDKLNTIYTPNPEFVMNAREDEEFRNILNEGDLVIPDGIGVVYASRIFKNPVSERVAGYDLIQNIFKKIKDREYTVYIFGAKPGVAQRAKENMEQLHKGLKIVGFDDGYADGRFLNIYDDMEKINRTISDINSRNADILLVGLGSPKQEKFINLYKGMLNCKVVIGCGGCFDGMAGYVKRAPYIFQRLGLEWFYRLLKEPKRIGRMMKLPHFMWLAIKEKKKWIKENF